MRKLTQEEIKHLTSVYKETDSKVIRIFLTNIEKKYENKLFAIKALRKIALANCLHVQTVRVFARGLQLACS